MKYLALIFRTYWWVYGLFALLIAISQPPLSEVIRIIVFLTLFTGMLALDMREKMKVLD